jgi:hypothetical protein
MNGIGKILERQNDSALMIGLERHIHKPFSNIMLKKQVVPPEATKKSGR